MAKTSAMGKTINFVAWLTGVIVSLAVGSALIEGTIAAPLIGSLVNVMAGWVVVILTIVGVILAIANRA